MADQLEELALMLGGYFHQDWDSDAETDKQVIELFMSSEPASTVEEVRQVLELFCSADDFSAKRASDFISSSGCAYGYEFEGLDAAEWLRRILGYLQTT